QIVEEWNETAREMPEATLVELFEEQAQRTSDEAAVAYEGEEFTYRELNERANRLAHLLIGEGVGPEDGVAVGLRRSLEMSVALAGILKAGAAYLPIDQDYPVERIDFMLRDAAPVLALSAGALRENLPQTLDVLSFGDPEMEAALACAPLHNPTNVERTAFLLPQHAAYIIYTSGSTGRPKGVVVSHQGLTNYLSWARGAYEAESGRGAPINTSLSFDATITSLYVPLIAGGMVNLLPEGRQLEALAEMLGGGAELTLVKVTPGHLEGLQGLLGAKASGVRARRFVVGGEALKESVAGFWREQVPSLQIVNEYGPTETVVGSCVYEMGGQAEPSGDVPIGRPIWNTRVYVLDEG